MATVLISREVFQLNNVQGGLRPGAISFKTVSLESDKFVAVRDVQPDGQASLALVDIERSQSERHNVKDAEAAVMNPVTRILALRSGLNLQLFNLDLRQRVKACQVSSPVSFWKWANPTTLAIVTQSEVYHWAIDGASDPVKMFDRAAEIDANAQILNYSCDAKGKWFMLNAVARGDTGLVGKTQLYSAENGASRVLEGHAGCFHSMRTPHDARESNILALAWNNPQGGRLLLMELPSSEKMDSSFERRQVSLPISNPADFPVICQMSPTHKLLSVITSRGQAIVVDPITGSLICAETVTPNVIFCGTLWSKTGGVLCVNNQGSVFHVSINNDIIARHINSTVNPEVALRIASNANLTGVDELFRSQFNNLMMQQNIPAAIEVCRAAPNGILRTPDVLLRFSQLTVPGQPPAISTYFKTMLAAGKLNGPESVELAKVVLAKGGAAYVKQQYDEDKLTITEELGAAVAEHDQDLAMKMFHSVGAHHRVINILLGRGDTANAVSYCQRANFNPDWRLLLTNFVRSNPAESVNLAMMLHSDMPNSPVLDPLDVVEMYLPGQNIRPATEFLVKVLKDRNVPETAALQTKLLEINLKYSPASVAEKILSQGFASYYDPMVIGPLCERANLFQYALDCYSRVEKESNHETSMLSNMKRCLAHANTMNPSWLIEFFGRLLQKDSLSCLQELLLHKQANFKIIVQIATKYSDALGATNLIDLFLEAKDGKAFDVLYYYLGAVVAYSRDPEVHFRYIEAAAEVGQVAEVDRMTAESPCYDPLRTKNYLKEKALADLWPLINVCDKHDYIEEMIKFLLDSDKKQFIEQYVQRRNPLKTPKVVSALLEFDAGEKLVLSVLDAAGAMCPLDELVKEVEDRGRLKLLQKFLEARAAEKRTDAALHNALAKIYVDANSGAEQFLSTNEFYDALTIGTYCETRDPHLAFVAYEKGRCHSQLIALGIKNGMWKPLARYLVKQKDLELWSVVLGDKSFEHKYLVEAVRHDALANSDVAEDVITTVRAFMKAEMTQELTAILDQVVVHGQFQKNKYLENLLLISAIKSTPAKVMEYVNKLENYDPLEIGPMAVEAELFEAAYTVYHKNDMKKEAVAVLLNNLNDVYRGRAYAVDAKLPAVWTVLGLYLLRNDDVHDAIEALITAKNAEYVQEVVAAADRVNQFGDLIKYLTMARTESKTKDPQIDTFLVLTFAKTGRMSELEEFLKNTTHSVNVIAVADKCFQDELYDSARVLYTAASNYPKLASTLVRLKNFAQALEAAQHAQNTKTWKEVHVACLAAGEDKLAELAATSIVGVAEELRGMVDLYTSIGKAEQIMNVLRGTLGSQSAPMALYTELGMLYAKHKPDKLLEHVKMYPKKINTHKMIHACREYHHWLVLRVLHVNNEDWLAAAQSMMDHPVTSWDHEIFKDVLLRLGTSDVCYNAIGFYVQNAPEKLHDLLMTLSKKMDTERVMHETKKHAPLTLIKPFLEATQDRNARRVNDVLNGMYVEEEDFASLRNSVDKHNNFDSAELSSQLEKMPLFEFRRIALLLHRRNKRYFHAIETAKKNELWGDAIEAAAESGEAELVRNLLEFFCKEKRADCFAATLYMCYDFVPNHVGMELSWMYGMQDAAMPFLIQSSLELHERVASLEKTMTEAKKQVQEARATAAAVPHATLMIGGPVAPL